MIGHQAFADELRARIERRYVDGGYRLGWRLLYSPAVVLEGTRVAFVGLNPGGGVRRDDHAEFAMSSGSAWVVESWKGRPPGKAPLQRKVLSLFELLGEKPEAVLSGNLVPFRSPDWDALPGDKKALVSFGKDLWRDMILRARPSLVIACGTCPFNALRQALGGTKPEKYGLDWGRVAARRCVWPGGELVGLPHLSHYQVVTSRRDAILRLLRGFVDEC